MQHYEIQAGAERYRHTFHDDVIQWLSYWYQIEEVLRVRPRSILEVGVGNRTTSTYLQARGVRVLTVDHDPQLRPSSAGEVGWLPLQDESVDCAVCCQVLEHIRYEDVPAALKELRRVTREWVVISVPYSVLYLGIAALPFYALFLDPAFRILGLRPNQPIGVMLRMPFWFLKRPSHPSHFWEMGQRGTSRDTIRGLFRSVGFEIVRERSHLLYGYHYYFVLRKAGIAATACS